MAAHAVNILGDSLVGLATAPMSLICGPADRGSRSNSFNVRPNILGLRLLVLSVGRTFTSTTVKGGGNMNAYTVVKATVRLW